MHAQLGRELFLVNTGARKVGVSAVVELGSNLQIETPSSVAVPELVFSCFVSILLKPIAHEPILRVVRSFYAKDPLVLSAGSNRQVIRVITSVSLLTVLVGYRMAVVDEKGICIFAGIIFV